MAKKAAIYSRVSTSTGQQSTSRQVNELMSYAKNLDFTIHYEDVYEEFQSGYSKKKDREQLNKLLNSIRSGENKYEAIFISEISRISRDPKIGREIVEELTEMNIPVYVKNPQLVSIENDGKRSGMFNIIFQILLEFANTEAEYLKIRIKSGLLDKIKSGGAGSGVMHPYGYTSIEKKLVILEEEAEVIKKIFQLCIDGNGTKKIANRLNELNIPTKTNKLFDKELKQKNGRPPIHSKDIKWKDGTVYGILANPIYKGQRKFIRHDDNENLETMKVGDKIYNLFNCPSIVSNETWELAQETFKKNIISSIRNQKFFYILKGILICGECGGTYYGKMRSDLSDKYYMCSSRRSKSRPCNNPGISIELVESAVWTFLQFNSDIDKLLLDINQNYNNNITEKEKITRRNIDLHSSIKTEKEKLRKIGELYIEGDWTREQYQKKSNQQKNLIEKINTEITNNESRIIVLDESINSVNDLNEMKLIKKALIKDRKMISDLVNKLIKRISIYVLNKEYALLSFKYKFGELNYTILVDRQKKLLIPVTNDLTKSFDEIIQIDEYGRIENDKEILKDICDFYSDEGNMGFREPLIWIPFN